MAEQKFINLAGLEHYDEKIKAFLAQEDAKTLQSAKDYVLTVADAAGTAATKVAELENGKVKANTDAIAKLNGSGEGSVAKAVSDAKTELEGTIGTTNANVDNLKKYVGTIPEGASATDVIGYVQEKTTGIASSETLNELTERVAGTENDVKAIKADYLKAADKTELQESIATAQQKADKVGTDLESAKTELAAADAALGERTAALEGKITGLSGAMHFEGKKESVPTTFDGYEAGDVILVGEKEYVFDGTGFVEFGDVSAEGQRIGTLETKVAAVEPKVTTLESDMAQAKSDITDLNKAKDDLKAADTALGNRISTLESKFTGDDSVEELITAAKAEAIATAGTNADTKDAAILKQAKDYTDTEIGKVNDAATALTARVAKNETDIASLTTKVTTAEGEIDDLQTAVETTLPTSIAEAKKAGTDAQTTANQNKTDIAGLQTKVTANESSLSAHGDRLTVLETKVGDGFVAISNSEIDALFV